MEAAEDASPVPEPTGTMEPAFGPVGTDPGMSTRVRSPSEVELALDGSSPLPPPQTKEDKTMAGEPVLLDDSFLEPLGPATIPSAPSTEPSLESTRDRVAEAQAIRSSEHTQLMRRRRKIRVILLGVLAVSFLIYAAITSQLSWLKEILP